METAFKRPPLSAVIPSARKPFPDPPKTVIWLFSNCSKEERAETSISLHRVDSKCTVHTYIYIHLYTFMPQHAAMTFKGERFESTVPGAKFSCHGSGRAGLTFRVI